MKWKKNLIKIPEQTLSDISSISSNYLKIACLKQIPKADIINDVYSHISINIKNGSLSYVNDLIPNIQNGRYSKYNQKGRSIVRKDLPKVNKWFSHDIYPYGDTSRDTVAVTQCRKVWQKELWVPEWLSINIKLEKEDKDYYYFDFEINDFLDKTDPKFNHSLLFYINLLQENCGNFNVYQFDATTQDIVHTQYVDWELLPPGEIEVSYLVRDYDSKPLAEKNEIMDRLDFIKSLKPKSIIKGTNKLNQYFGAKFDNGVVVLENTHSGNAIYAFYEDWEALSKFSRTELRMMNTDKITRIQHTGNWKVILQKSILI